MGAVDIVILIGAIMFAVEGIAKLIKPDIRLWPRKTPPPCGLSMLILGVGLALKAIGV